MGVRSGLRGRLDADERAELEGLVAEFGPRLLAYTRHLTSPQDAEDVVAEVFCRAAQNFGALRRSARPDLYLLTAARNLCRDGLRRRRPQPLPPERIDQSASARDGPPAGLTRDETRRRLRAAVAELPAPLREVVVLRLTVGLRFEDIAGLLGLPLGTALSRMHTAIGCLRERLGRLYEH
ncbi:MAG: sigma-70 family RNA polymerase sigma factor [Planctomycetota bacterium]